MFGPQAALDRLKAPEGVLVGRVAADEVLWVSPDVGRAAELVANASGQLKSEGDKAYVIEHSDGYAMFELAGTDNDEVFARLSSVQLPIEGFAQGKFATVPGKLFVHLDGQIDVLVTSDVAWFVQDRFAHAGAGHGITVGGHA